VVAGVVLACVAIAVPFGAGVLDRDGVRRSPSPVTPSATDAAHHPGGGTSSGLRATLGPRGDLPPLLARGRPGLTAGAQVRVGVITDGALRHIPGIGWQVVVRWDGRLQPLAMRGPVSLRAPSWVSASGLLYTRVSTGTPGRFHVYAWSPVGGSAYTPPALVAADLGPVCFNRSFTAFGNCHLAG
jgi:hypothetical protein